MPRRFVHRVALARAPRGLTRRVRTTPVRSLASAKRSLKRATMRDCGRRCVYCGMALELDSATIDHVYPVSRGGPHVLGNLVSACGACIRMKGDMLPFEFFARYPWAGANFVRYARAVHRALKRGAKRAVSLAYAA